MPAWQNNRIYTRACICVCLCIPYVQSQQCFGLGCIEPGSIERQRPDFLSLSVQQCDIGAWRRGHIWAGQWAHGGWGH